MKEKLLKLGAKAPIIFGILAIVVLILGLQICTKSFLQAGLIRILCFILIYFVLWPVLQNKHLKFPGTGWKFSFKLSRTILIFSMILGCILVGSMVAYSISPELSANVDIVPGDNIPTLRSNVLLQLLYLVIMVIGVGMVEEMAFRRGVFFCLYKQLGGSKKALLISAIVSSIFFGYVHIAAGFSTDKFVILCSLLKTLQTGLMGFVMCGAYFESQNIWPVAMIHAINDGCLLLGTLWNSDATIGQYVYGSDDPAIAIRTIVVYSILSLIYLPSAIKAYKVLKNSNLIAD